MRTLDVRVFPVFKPLLRPARYKGAWGGRGSGKSHFFATLLVSTAIGNPGLRAGCFREVQKSLKDSVKRLIEDKIEELGVGSEFTIRADSIVTPGNGIILFQGLQDHTAESVKSFEGINIAYCEESQTITERSLELLRPTIRAHNSELWFSWNPRSDIDPVDRLLRGEEKPLDAIVVRANYMDNKNFPAVLEEERRYDLRSNPHRYAHIWEGEYEPQAIGALWTRDMIIRARKSADFMPKFAESGRELGGYKRIVVAVDPAISAEKYSNETGIVACGLGHDGNAYVLQDWTIVGLPEEWARRAVSLFDILQADQIVCEANQGGEMCAATFRTVRPGIPLKMVQATRGKVVRADPISALYSVNKVFHVGSFPELERQMCMMTADGYQGDGSPDRVDALVWGITSLFSAITRPQASTQTFRAFHGHDEKRR